jgi:hypothetical protein
MLWVRAIDGAIAETRPGNEPPEDPTGWMMYRTRLPLLHRRGEAYRGTLVGEA